MTQVYVLLGTWESFGFGREMLLVEDPLEGMELNVLASKGESG
jgi:hypothetical protein